MCECRYELAWVGRCDGLAIENGLCEEHKDIKCVSCGAIATHECSETGGLVCGAPLCDDCEHTICETGDNGGIGFFRKSKLPEGMKSHCKKTEQKFFPWYVISFGEDDEKISNIINEFNNGNITYVIANKRISEYCEKLNNHD